jgi:DNA-binding MarR family transcriptional regulator
MTEQGQSLFLLVGALHRNMVARMREALAPYELHPAQFAALAGIAEREGLTQAELTLKLDLEQPGVARTLSGLEADGWIEKGSAGKGRAQALYLSERARLVMPDATRAASGVDRMAMADLGRSEAAHLLDQIEQLGRATRQ